MALLLLGAGAYANAFFAQFVWDDFPVIVLNEHLRAWRNLPVLLTSDMYRSIGFHVSEYYRPFTVLTFFLDYQLWGLKPFGFHLTSIGLHLINALLVYRVWTHLSSPEAAFLAALFWVVHPVHVEAVAYISSRGEILYTLWGLTAILLCVKGRLVGSLVALAAALFSKENAVILPAVLGVVGFVRGWARRKLALYMVLAVLLVLAHLSLRLALGIALTFERGQGPGALERGLLALKVLGVYVGLIVFPLHLQFPRSVAHPQHLLDPAVVLGVVLLVAGLVLVGFAWRRWPGVAIGISWFLLGLLPVSNLTWLNVPVAEHWLYFPAVGVCGAAGVGVLAMARRVGRVPVGVGVGILVGLLALRTFVGNVDWRDEPRLALKVARNNPESAIAWKLVGASHFRRGEMGEAALAVRRAVALAPHDWMARGGLGQILTNLGRYEEAEQHLRMAVILSPDTPWNHYHLGNVLDKRGKREEALAEWRRALQVDPLFKPAQKKLERRKGQR